MNTSTNLPKSSASEIPTDIAIPTDLEWLTVPDICEMLDITPGRVHRLVEERKLLSTRVNGIIKIPAAFMKDGKPLSSLQGTVMLLLDSGFNTDQAIAWLFTFEESMGESPMALLLKGHKSQVRRVAQALSL